MLSKRRGKGGNLYRMTHLMCTTPAGGAVVRALFFHQCGLSSIPGHGVIMWFLFVVGSLCAPRCFSSGTPVFPSPQKPTFLNPNSIGNSMATALSVARQLSVTLY